MKRYTQQLNKIIKKNFLSLFLEQQSASHINVALTGIHMCVYIIMSVTLQYLKNKKKKKLISTYRPDVAGALTNFTANRNWIPHTRRQDKFNVNDSAHRANVTSS